MIDRPNYERRIIDGSSKLMLRGSFTTDGGDLENSTEQCTW
jgi:hypothetical protein